MFIALFFERILMNSFGFKFGFDGNGGDHRGAAINAL